jgi:ankyrin repeat protein
LISSRLNIVSFYNKNCRTPIKLNIRTKGMLDKDQAGCTTAAALHSACETGNQQVTAELLQAGAAVDAQDERWNQALHVAGKSYVSCRALEALGAAECL